MPTVSYKCNKTGKIKKRSFPYNAMGKAQSTEFSKLMDGTKKNNPGPKMELTGSSEIDLQKLKSKEKLDTFKKNNPGIKNVKKRRKAKKETQKYQKELSKLAEQRKLMAKRQK